MPLRLLALPLLLDLNVGIKVPLYHTLGKYCLESSVLENAVNIVTRWLPEAFTIALLIESNPQAWLGFKLVFILLTSVKGLSKY